jgi:hypothetical protein
MYMLPKRRSQSRKEKLTIPTGGALEARPNRQTTVDAHSCRTVATSLHFGHASGREKLAVIAYCLKGTAVLPIQRTSRALWHRVRRPSPLRRRAVAIILPVVSNTRDTRGRGQ